MNFAGLFSEDNELLSCRFDIVRLLLSLVSVRWEESEPRERHRGWFSRVGTVHPRIPATLRCHDSKAPQMPPVLEPAARRKLFQESLYVMTISTRELAGTGNV